MLQLSEERTWQEKKKSFAPAFEEIESMTRITYRQITGNAVPFKSQSSYLHVQGSRTAYKCTQATKQSLQLPSDGDLNLLYAQLSLCSMVNAD
jgi:hypothetical protein